MQRIVTETATKARKAVAADLDGDGSLDLAVCSDGGLVWFRNEDGLGGFGGERVVNADTAAEDVFAADLDLDGSLDLVAASGVNRTINWYRNNGTGGFSEALAVWSDGSTPVSVFVALVDDDEFPDIVAAASTADKVSWFRNNGSGGFGDEQIITTAVSSPSTVFAADLDADGHMDVLSSSFADDTVAWYRNNGTGGFSEQLLISRGVTIASAAFAADLTNDGHLDVVALSVADNRIAFFPNDGQGNFGAERVIYYRPGIAPFSVFVADMDGDGDLDVVASLTGENSVSLFDNLDNTDTFGTELVVSSLVRGTPGRSFAGVADFNSDGRPDVFSSSQEDGEVAWYPQHAEAETLHTPLAPLASAYSAAAGDVNGDGSADVVAAFRDENLVGLFINDGAGGFSERRVVADGVSDAFFCAFGLVNGDDDPDIVWAAATGGGIQIGWKQNDGSGGFGGSRMAVLESRAPEGAVVAVLVHDLDGDGDADVVAGFDGLPSTIAWFENTDGNGTFVRRDVAATLHGSPSSFAVGDIDGDGIATDIVFTIPFPGTPFSVNSTVAWLRSNGSGFADAEQRTITSALLRPLSVVVLGAGDVAVASRDDDTVSFFRNLGGGTFAPQQVVTDQADGASSLAVLNGADLAVFSRISGDLTWHENRDGAGNFGPARLIATLSGGSASVHASNLDGYGGSSNDDILVASAPAGTVSWYRTTADPDPLVSFVAATVSPDGKDSNCSAAVGAGRPCATVGVGAERLSAAAAVAASAPVNALLSLSAGTIPTGPSPVLLAPPADGVALLTVQVDEAGTVLECPGAELDASCLTIASGVALIGGPLTVSGGRSAGDGGCVTVRADREAFPGGRSVLVPQTGPVRVPLFNTEASPLLDAFVLRGGLFRLLAGVARAGLPAGARPDPPPAPARPAESSLSLVGCESAARGGGLAVADTAAAAATGAELGRITVTGCRAAGDGGGAALVRSFGGLVVARTLSVSNCSAGGSGGGLYADALYLYEVLGGAGTVVMDGNEATGCGPDVAVAGSSSVVGDASLVGLGVALPSSSPVCVSRGARAVLPPCGGPDELAAESQFGAVVVVPPSCPAGSVTCSGGQALRDNGTAVCSSCARGRAPVVSGDGATDVCQPCEAGRFAATDGVLVCEQCEAGRSTQDSGGAVSCAACPRGEYAAGAGSPDCERCEAGRFQNETGRDGCHDCPAGRAGGGAGAVECVQCGVGRYSLAGRCEPCEAGRFGAAAEAESCEPCPAGSASGAPGAAECVACPRGEYANATGLTRCLACDEGRYQPDANSTACRECDAGSFSDGPGSVQCVLCPPGRASSSKGSLSCVACANHTHASAEGRHECVPCNATEHRFADRQGAQVCDRCDPDEYLSFADRSRPSTFRGCLPCPAGTSCASGQPLALTSAWVSPLDAATGEYRALDCLPGRCLSARACDSGGGAAAGDASCCAAGRRLPAAENPMCGACEAGKQEWGGECVPCTRTDTGLVLGYLALGVALLLVLQQVTAGTSGAAVSKVAVGFAQAAFAFFADEGDDSPVGGGAALSFDPLGLESSCVAPMSDLTRAVLPLVQLLVVSLLFVALGALNAAWWSARGRRAGFRTSPFTRVSVALAVFGYFPVFRVAVNLLRCVELPGGARVLRQYPTVSCSSVGYHAWVGVSWTLAGALLVGLSSLILAYGRPRYLAYWWKGDEASKGVLKAVEKRVGFLHLSYRGDSALSASWEVAVLARSSAFVAAAALGGSSDSRFALLTLVSLAALTAHLYVQPFRRAADNRLEAVALAALAVIGSLNNSGWRGSSAARALTALLYYGVIACAVALTLLLQQGRIRSAAWAVRGRIKGSSSSSAGSSLGRAPGDGSNGSDGDEGPTAGGPAVWLSRFFCWHLPRGGVRAPAPVRRAAAEVEMDDSPAPSAAAADTTVVGADGREWSVFQSAEGVPYYVSAASGVTQWERP